jgi:hypothetical protein
MPSAVYRALAFERRPQIRLRDSNSAKGLIVFIAYVSETLRRRCQRIIQNPHVTSRVRMNVFDLVESQFPAQAVGGDIFRRYAVGQSLQAHLPNLA